MKKADRLKELEKIAEKLGIGQNREVECVSCKKKIQFKDAILLTNKETVSHLCSMCNDKLTKGELTKKQIGEDEILKQIEELQKDANRKLVPYIPDTKQYPWMRTEEPWVMPYKQGDITYHIYSNTAGTGDDNKMLLRLEPE